MTIRPNRPAAGFTLLELLIALAIFGLLSVMSYGGLRTVMDQQAATETAADRLGELQKIYLLMQRDLEQVVPRAIRGEYGDVQPALDGSDVLQFTRGGWSNPLGRPRSDLQRVAYAFEDEELVRYTWQVLDRAQDTLPDRRPLTPAIRDMMIRYLTAAGEWRDSWPDEDDEAAPGTGPSTSLLPQVVEITLDHEHFGEIVWLFRLPQ